MDLLRPVRERYVELRADEAALEAVLQEGAGQAREIATGVMEDVRAAMGVGPQGSSRLRRCRVVDLDLDLEVFQGPFDLLMTLVLNEEVDLLEVDLADVVLAYVAHLERAGELDLEAATEFLVLIAALLELKSRLMLPVDEDEEGLDLEPGEAADELLARMLEYHRYRGAAADLRERLDAEHGFRYRSAPLPPELRRVAVETGRGGLRPRSAGRGARRPAAHPAAARPSPRAPSRGVRSSSACATCATCCATRRSFSFDEAVQGADRLTEAVTLFALLELYKAGEAAWEQEVPFGPITVQVKRDGRAAWASSRGSPRRCSSCPPEPLPVDRWPTPARSSEGEVVEALARLREHYADGYRGVVLREVAGGFTLATDPVAERAARRLLARPRTPPLTQAQAECLAIVAYLQPVSRPEVARIRGVASESAVGTLLERGLVEESGRSRFGATMYRTTELFERLFGLSGARRAARSGAFRPQPGGAGRAARAAGARGRAARPGLRPEPQKRAAACHPNGSCPANGALKACR